MAAVARFDGFQQRNSLFGVPIATAKKFTEDKSTNLAAMIAFWAFFSIFPLFLAFVTLLGYFLPSDTKANVLHHVSSMFPLLDPSTVGSLSGNWWALALGLGSALWSGTAAVRVVQFAFNSVWEVPYRERPKVFEKMKRSLLVLLVLGGGIVVSTVITGFVSGSSNGINLGIAGRIAGYVLSIALDIGIFIAAFRMLTDRDVTTRDVLPGALFSGIVFWVLQSASSLIISRYLQNAQSTYAHFATVITILWWFYLQSILTLLGAQVNVVLKEQLWPRSVVGAPSTDADHRALEAYARERTYVEGQRVSTGFAGRHRRDDIDATE